MVLNSKKLKNEVKKFHRKKNRKLAKPSVRFANSIKLYNLNKSPIAMSKRLRFNYEFNFEMETSIGEHSKTQLFNMQSPYDPDLSNRTRNSSASYWNTFMGTNSGQYGKFLVTHCTVELSCMTTTSSQLMNVVYSLSERGINDYSPSYGISTIGQRPMATTLVVLKSGGNIIKKKMDVIPYKIHGIPKKDYTMKVDHTNTNTYGYWSSHNAISTQSSWLAVTIGGQPNLAVPPEVTARFQGRIVYHGIAFDPVVTQTNI